MKNPKALLIALGAIVLIGVGFFLLRGPKPIIEIKGEPLWTGSDYGDFLTPMLLNTTFTGVCVMMMISVFVIFGLRKLQLIPRGIQNAVEAVTEALYNICIQLAGEKNGRRFFPVAASLFVFIWLANWFALTPIFNSFGLVQDVNPHHWHDEAHILEDVGGISMIMPFQLGGDSPSVEFEVDESEYLLILGEKTDAKAAGASREELQEIQHEADEALEHAREEAFLAAMPGAAGLEVDYSACEEEHLEGEALEACERELNIAHGEEALTMLEEQGKQVAVIYPFFRSFNTDLNSPLALAIVSVCFIEFWGITALGFFKYGSKFIRNPITDPIGAFVGLLEIIAEFARLISFTFRLFGNMLAGEILLLVITFLMPFLVALPFYGLELFVGAIQGFVFFALTIAFGALAVASHDHEDHGEEHEHGEHEHEVVAPAAAH